MLPLATTTITILRVPMTPDDDPFDGLPPADVIASGVRAHISSPSGRELGMGQQESIDMSLSCDVTDLQNEDQVRDDKNGRLYQVTYVQPRYGFGLDHMSAGLKRVEGLP